jgi:hypothetical protein
VIDVDKARSHKIASTTKNMSVDDLKRSDSTCEHEFFSDDVDQAHHLVGKQDKRENQSSVRLQWLPFLEETEVLLVRK